MKNFAIYKVSKGLQTDSTLHCFDYRPADCHKSEALDNNQVHKIFNKMSVDNGISLETKCQLSLITVISRFQFKFKLNF